MDIFGAKEQGATATATVTAAPAPALRPLRLKANDYFPWRRFIISLVGIFLILFQWRWSVNHLYTLPVTSIAAFCTITIAAMYANTFIVAYFITGQAYFTNWSNATIANTLSEAKSYFESKKSTERKVTKGK